MIIYFIQLQIIQREAITGGTVYSKYRSVISGSKRRFLSQLFSTFIPAFFATHLIRIKRKPIYDVSRWLGHRDEKQREQSTFITYLDRTICIQTTG